MLRIRPAFAASCGVSDAHSAGGTGSVSRAPKVAMVGPSTRYDSTAPAIIRPAMRGPIR